MASWSAQKILLVIYLILINLISLWMYGIDKYRAKKRKWRIPELSLLMSAALGGGFGALGGMLVFRHKTKHVHFRILVPLFLLIWLGLLFYLLAIVKI